MTSELHWERLGMQIYFKALVTTTVGHPGVIVLNIHSLYLIDEIFLQIIRTW